MTHNQSSVCTTKSEQCVVDYFDERATTIHLVADRNITSNSKHQVPEHKHWSLVQNSTTPSHRVSVLILFLPGVVVVEPVRPAHTQHTQICILSQWGADNRH